MSIIIQQLTELGTFSLEYFNCENKEDCILAKWKEKRAVYHHNCVSNYSQKLKRKLEKKNKESSKKSGASANKCSRRSEIQSRGGSRLLQC